MRRPRYIIILCCCVISQLSAQLSIQHKTEIKSLAQGPNKQVLLTDIHNHNYQMVNGELQSTTAGVQKDALLQALEIRNGQLRNNLGNSYQLYELPFVPTSVTRLGESLMLSSDSGIWILENGRSRKYFVPGVSFPSDVIKVVTEGDIIAMLTADKELFVFHVSSQILKFIDNQVVDFTIDGWKVLWYANGKTLYNSHDYAPARQPDFSITQILDVNQNLINPPLNLAADQTELLVQFTAHYPPLMDKVELSYKLNEDPWKEIESRSQLLIRKLPEGRSELVLKATGINEQTTVTKPIQIKVQQAEYSRFWPWLFGILLLLFGLNLFSQFRLRNEMKNLDAQKEKLALQLQVESEKQKLGQLQMNPHFIFNTLNSISGLIALNENKRARTNLHRFSKMMRKLLEHSQKEFIPLSEELEFLNSYLELEQLIRNNKFDYVIHKEVADNYMVPVMVIQPFLENAIIHGLNPKTEKGQLSLTITEDPQHLIATIEDNGIGRARAALNKKESHESAAIHIIEQRLSKLNRWAKKGLLYEDMIAADGTALGTKVLIHLPKTKSSYGGRP